MNVTLLHYGPALGLPDLSPFCVKLVAYLRLAQLPYTSTQGNPMRAPKGKLPCIVHDGEVVADSSEIIRYLEARAAAPLDAALTLRQRATARAVQSMLEEHLYFIIGYFRWQAAEGWRAYRPAIREAMARAGAPRLLAPAIAWWSRRGVLRALHGQGIGRHSAAENAAAGRALIDAIAAHLGDGAFFFGDAPSTLDATVYAFMASILTPPIPSPVQDHARSCAPIVAYCERVSARMDA